LDKRLYWLAEDTRERGDEIKAALPDDVRFEKVPASFLGLVGDEDFKTEGGCGASRPDFQITR
jgi:hypothetical protein